MSHTITVRLSPELAAWLVARAKATGIPQGQIIRDELERASVRTKRRGFMRLAGCVDGARDRSTRKGFSPS